jgi:hypothetical protein
MFALHPKILEKDGKKEFAILPYEEFLVIQETLGDYEDLKALREAKLQEASATTISFDDAKKKLDIK